VLGFAWLLIKLEIQIDSLNGGSINDTMHLDTAIKTATPTFLLIRVYR